MMNAEEKRESRRKNAAAWQSRNPEKQREAEMKWKAKNVERVKAATAKWQAENQEMVKATKDRWKDKNPEKFLLRAAKARSKQKGIPFSITVEDIVIPEKCPALGTPFKTNTWQAASLDRIIPVLGYVPGNVQVISRRANTIKSNASSEEIQAVCDWLRNLEKS